MPKHEQRNDRRPGWAKKGLPGHIIGVPWNIHETVPLTSVTVTACKAFAGSGSCRVLQRKRAYTVLSRFVAVLASESNKITWRCHRCLTPMPAAPLLRVPPYTYLVHTGAHVPHAYGVHHESTWGR